MKEFISSYLESLNQQNFWRLFVDGARQKTSFTSMNKMGDFEEVQLGHFLWVTREPNGLNKLKEAAKELYTHNLNVDLSFKFIEDLHQKAYPFQDHLKYTTGHLKTGSRFFGHINHTEQGINEAKNIIKRAEELQKLTNSASAPWSIQQTDQNSFEISSNGWSYEEKVKNYSIVYNNYQSSISSANTEDEKIEIIAQFMQDLECLHIFKDGNCRMVYLLLNKELMKHDISPVILLNPNYLDNMVIADLIKEIKDGQKAFAQFIKIGLPYDDCVSEEEIQKNISSIPNKDFKIFGYEELSFNKTLEYTEMCLEIYKSLSNDVIKNNVTNINELLTKWNVAMVQNLVTYQYYLETKKQAHSTKLLNLLIKNPAVSNKILHIINKDQSVLTKYKSLDQATSFVELLNANLVIEYMQENGFDFKNFKTIKALFLFKNYLTQIKSDCEKYINEYTIESLSNPMLCHLTAKEQEELDSKDIEVLSDQITNLDLGAVELSGEADLHESNSEI